MTTEPTPTPKDEWRELPDLPGEWNNKQAVLLDGVSVKNIYARWCYEDIGPSWLGFHATRQPFVSTSAATRNSKCHVLDAVIQNGY